MNERIKTTCDKFAVGKMAAGGSSYFDYYNEKFAELIISECADMFPDDLSSMRDYTGKACRYMIKEQSGLNEKIQYRTAE